MSEIRKSDHIGLTEISVPTSKLDLKESYYEPLLGGIGKPLKSMTQFGPFQMNFPFWISSMTGGTKLAKNINHNLAKLCGEYGLGMGLGSCRSLLDSNDRFDDFNVKSLMNGQPLFTNFGIAQLEELVKNKEVEKINDVVSKLNADGVIIHINPLQEFMQPEGDRYKETPIRTLEMALSEIGHPVIVKEVGQGFGPKSLEALFRLPIFAIDLAGFGGTNFTKIEEFRLSEDDSIKKELNKDLYKVGHSCSEMIEFINSFDQKIIEGKELIISGGLKGPLDGVLHKNQLKSQLSENVVFGYASLFLKYAKGDYKELKPFMEQFIDGHGLAVNLIKG